MANVFEKHKSKLVGVWSLVTAAMYDSEGPDRKLLSMPYGDDPQGKVVVSSSGFLLATLVSPNGLEPLASDDWTESTDEEVVRIGRSLTTYGGFMTVQEQDDGSLLWHTKVEIGNNPNWIGKPQIRVARFEEENGESYMTLNPVKWYTLKVCFPCSDVFVECELIQCCRMAKRHEESSNGEGSPLEDPDCPICHKIYTSPASAFSISCSLFSSIVSFDLSQGFPSRQKPSTINVLPGFPFRGSSFSQSQRHFSFHS